MNFELTGANLFAGILFGGIGTAAFIYGKKQGSFKTMSIAGIMLLYPFLVSNTVAMYVIGAALTIGLFVFRD